MTRGAPAKKENLHEHPTQFAFSNPGARELRNYLRSPHLCKRRPSSRPIARNLGWNDFITQIKFSPLDSPQDSIDKEMLVIQRFLREHETETNVGVYDLAVFRAIDQVRARLHSRQRSGNAPKRTVLQGRTSKAGEVNREICSVRALQQM